MSKIIEFDINARRKLREGMNLLAQSVIITFGPKGRTVVFEKINGEPQVCNDGLTVARQVELDDPVEDLGAKMLRQAAIKTSEKKHLIRCPRFNAKIWQRIQNQQNSFP